MPRPERARSRAARGRALAPTNTQNARLAAGPPPPPTPDPLSLPHPALTLLHSPALFPSRRRPHPETGLHRRPGYLRPQPYRLPPAPRQHQLQHSGPLLLARDGRAALQHARRPHPAPIRAGDARPAGPEQPVCLHCQPQRRAPGPVPAVVGRQLPPHLAADPADADGPLGRGPLRLQQPGHLRPAHVGPGQHRPADLHSDCASFFCWREGGRARGVGGEKGCGRLSPLSHSLPPLPLSPFLFRTHRAATRRARPRRRCDWEVSLPRA